MKKNKLKNLLKCGILLFGISILIISCQNESLEKEVISPEFQTERLEYHRTSASGLFKTDNTLKKHVLKKFSKKKNQNNLRLDSEEYGFSIDTSFVQIIMSSNYNSYTFIVEREDANPNILENYVYTEFSNGGFTQLIASYPIIDLDDEISYDIENSSAQYIIDEDLLAARTINCGSFSEEIYGFDPNAG